MRYRPFGPSGQASSALTLSLDDERTKKDDFVDTAVAALENGINVFETTADNPAGLEAIGEAVSGLDRKMLLIGLRLPAAAKDQKRDLTRPAIVKTFQEALRLTGLKWFDYLLIEDPEPGEIDKAVVDTLAAAQQAKRLRFTGLSGDSDELDRLIETGAFQILSTRYNLRSGWPVRNRMRLAAAHNMIVTGFDYHPRVVQRASGVFQDTAAAPRKPGFLGLGTIGKPKVTGVERYGPYAFLGRIQRWTPDEICLAYALTEPALASVRISAASPAEVEALATVPEKEMPNGIPAQIEMARVIEIS